MEGIVLNFAEDPEREDRSALISANRTVSILKSETLFATGGRQMLMKEIKKKRLISVMSTGRMVWDICVLLLSIFNSFSVPFEIAFLPQGSGVAMIVANALVDVVYVLDIVVQFRSTYMDEAGCEVVSPKLIAQHYFFSGKLALDAAAAVPFEFLDFFESKSLKLVALLKMLRLLRLSKIIRFMRSQDKVKLKLKLTQLMLFFVLYLHLQACFWFLLIEEHHTYVPPAMYVHGTSLFPSVLWRQYAYCLYMSVYMLTAAEIGPRNEWERIVAGICIIMGQIFQAFMFGEIAVVLFNMNARTSHIAEVQEAAATTMVNMKLPSKLQGRIMAYLILTQASSTNQSEFEEFFKILPPSLKQEVRFIIFKAGLEVNLGLRRSPELVNSVLLRLTNLYCQPEKNVVVQGDNASDLFFMIKGQCKVFVLDQHKIPHKVGLLGKGMHFGEIGLVYNTLRTATVQTVGHATLAVLSKKDFQAIAQKDAKFLIIFRRSAVRYDDPWKRFLVETLKQCPFLRSAPSKVLHEVIFQLPTVHLDPNTYICKEGDLAEQVTFIVDGEVEIYTPVNDSRLLTFPSNAHLSYDQEFVHKLRFRRGSLLAMKRTKDMRFFMKISMDKLGIGSVILPNLALLQGRVSFYAKTTEHTIALTLSSELLKSLCRKYPELKESVDGYKDYLRGLNESAKQQLINMIALDYEKNINFSSSTERTLWNAKMKIRRCVMGRILRQRADRTNNIVADLHVMKLKIEALLEADRHGDTELKEKIRRAMLPQLQCSHFWGLELLQIEEVNNPLLTQFAFQTAKMASILEYLKSRLCKMSYQASDTARQRKLAQASVEDLRNLARLALRLRSL